MNYLNKSKNWLKFSIGEALDLGDFSKKELISFLRILRKETNVQESDVRLDRTTDFFVSYRYGSEIEGSLYTDLDEAVRVNELNNDTFEKNVNQFFPSLQNKRPYKVMTLYDALEQIKDYVKDETEIMIRNQSEILY